MVGAGYVVFDGGIAEKVEFVGWLTELVKM